MQLHEARRANLSNKKRIRVGRGPGSGLGKTAGRGIKGATSRSGYAMKVTYEGGQMPLFRRLPKRGFTNGPFRVEYSVVNVGQLSSFPAGSKVSPEELRKSGLLVGPARNPVKILGDGEVTVSLIVSADAFSKSAIEKLQKAGGKIEWIGGAPKKAAPNFKQLEREKKKAAEKDKKPAEKGEKKEGEGKPAGEAKGQGKPQGGGEAKQPKPQGEAKQPKPQGEQKPKGEKKEEGK
jgi:large subunit ribosomal protein L15